MSYEKRLSRLERSKKSGGYKPPENADELLAEVERYHATAVRLFGGKPMTEKQRQRIRSSWNRGAVRGQAIRFIGEKR